MSKSLNSCQIIGNATKDAETRYTGTGTPVTSFTLACEEAWKDKSGDLQKRVEFISLVYWGKGGEAVAPYIKKGTKLYAEGKLQSREYEDKDGNKRKVFEVNVSQVILLSGGGERTGARQEASVPEFEVAGDDESEILPF